VLRYAYGVKRIACSAGHLTLKVGDLYFTIQRGEHMRFRNLLLVMISLIVVMTGIECARSTEIVGSGMIEVEEVQISSKLAGQILEIRADEGDRVKSGDTLVILDHKELLAQEKEALAGTAVAEQTLREIRARREELTKNVRRLEAVHREGAVADQDLEDLQTQLKVLEVQEEKAAAGLNAARAALDLVQTQTANATITSPLSGIVLARNFNEGETVFPGASIFTISDLKTAWLKIYVPEKEVGRIALGAEADVSVDTYPDKTFSGKVSWIASKAEFTPRNIQTKDDRAQLVFAVKMTLNNENEQLLPGMPADAKIMKNGHN
jgi:HlyD family secretion protein